MRWKGRERSDNVEDRRNMAPAAIGGGGLIMVVIIVLAVLFGEDPRPLLENMQQNAPQAGQNDQATAAQDDEISEFISVVLNDTEEVWTQLFANQVQGSPDYDEPKLVIFKNSFSTGCGVASSQVGPFYCPADQKIYIDPTFFDELKRRHNAPGDFAQAYVIAHEVAHHVQNTLGLMRNLNRARQSGNKVEINRNSVRVELQADYLAGVWAHHAQRRFQILEEGDIEEAMNAANQIGDDTLQKRGGGFVIPERFTHGTSEQRVRWFTAGLRSGDFNGCLRLMEMDYNDL